MSSDRSEIRDRIEKILARFDGLDLAAKIIAN